MSLHEIQRISVYVLLFITALSQWGILEIHFVCLIFSCCLILHLFTIFTIFAVFQGYKGAGGLNGLPGLQGPRGPAGGRGPTVSNTTQYSILLSGKG